MKPGLRTSLAAISIALLLSALAGAASAQPAEPPTPAPSPSKSWRALHAQQPAELPAERLEALRLIDAWLAAIQAFHKIPAMSVAVVSGERLIFAEGYGAIDVAGRTPANERTIYAIGSISKLLTSVALMQQVEAGRVRLDEPVVTYLPWARLHQSDPSSGPITVRALLSHAGGVPREAPFAYWTQPEYRFPSQEELRASITAQSTFFRAGERFQYSNLALMLVGEIVESVSGQPLDQYVQQHILSPLGMRDTRAGLPRDLLGKQLAPGFSGLDREGRRERVPLLDSQALLAAGGFSSTVSDLARFTVWQVRLRRGETAGLLAPASLREMHRVQFLDPAEDVSFGLGFHIERKNGDVFVGHDGEFPGYRAVLRLHPQSETAVIVLNNGKSPGAYAAAIFQLLKLRQGFMVSGEPPASGVSLEDYAGRYSEQPWSAEGVIAPWAGGLAYVSLPTDDPAGELAWFKPKQRDVFRRVRDDGSEAEEIRFVRNEQGLITHFIQHHNRHPRLTPLPSLGDVTR